MQALFAGLIGAALARVDLIINFFQTCGSWMKFWVILDHYEQGVVLRLGQYQRTIGAGLHWIRPFHIDRILCDSTVTNTARLNPQSLTTKDGVSVVVGALITSHVVDIKKLLLEVEDKDQAMIDMSFGVIADLVTRHTWDEIHTETFVRKMTRAVKRKGFRFGIEVEQVQFADLSRCRSIRLWSGV